MRGRPIGHAQATAPTAMPRCFLPVGLRVCAEISPIHLALAVQAGHVAPKGSLAPSQIHRRVFLPPPLLVFLLSEWCFLTLHIR